MKIKLYRSSTVGVNMGNFKILMDPWLTDGEYYGSWSHYPYFDFDSNLDELNSYNAIYISHIHPDHCSENTLRKLDKKIPIYIHTFHSKFLKAKLERLGFKVHELPNNKRTMIGKNAYLNIFAADNCNPELCFKFAGCANLNASNTETQQIDTLSLLDNGKKVLLNINDCPIELAQSTFPDIKSQYEKVNILLTGYGGAGPYPQCFENLNLDQKKIFAESKKNQFLVQATKFIDSIEPDFYLPFAGTYTLTGKLSKLQDLRGVADIDYAYEFFDNYYSSKKIRNKIRPIKLNPGSSFDLEANDYDQGYTRLDPVAYNLYISENLNNKFLSYENDDFPLFDEIYELSKSAHSKFLDKNIQNNISLDTDIFVIVNDKSIMIGKNSQMNVIDTKKIFEKSDKFVSYKTDIRLLKKLLMGPRYAHWNNAEIGSHINFYRKPNVFERNIYLSMCYFHS